MKHKYSICLNAVDSSLLKFLVFCVRKCKVHQKQLLVGKILEHHLLYSGKKFCQIVCEKICMPFSFSNRTKIEVLHWMCANNF